MHAFLLVNSTALYLAEHVCGLSQSIFSVVWEFLRTVMRVRNRAVLVFGLFVYINSQNRDTLRVFLKSDCGVTDRQEAAIYVCVCRFALYWIDDSFQYLVFVGWK